MLTINDAIAAVQWAKLSANGGTYMLGTGDYNTPIDGQYDCAGFAINRCWHIKRHRPEFNRGPWATIEDDINCNSAIEDAHHKQELFEPLTRPELGALLLYPTIYLKGHPPFIGHVGIVTAVPAEWDPTVSRWAELGIVQCHGPNGRKPGIVATDGSVWDHHDSLWPKPEHRSQLVIVKRNLWGTENG